MIFRCKKNKDVSDVPPVHIASQPPAGKVARRRRRWLLSASVVVVSLLVISALLFFQYFTSTSVSNIPTGKPVGGPVSWGPLMFADTESNGLETMLRISLGPYFLSELLPVSITVTNHSQQNIMLGGGQAINTCDGAFGVSMSGGHEPHYDLPMGNFMMSCPPGMTTLDINKSLSVSGYVPLTSSGVGAVTLMGNAYALVPQQGNTVNAPESQPLKEHWPSIAINVAAQIPSDRLISLNALGNSVLVNAPDNARSQLVYYFTVNCAHGSGTTDAWFTLKGTSLGEPSCDDIFRHWIYSVSAPGYAIASISMNFP
jgi:hypothetical protein